MTDNFDEIKDQDTAEDLNNICDECKEEDESVSQNLILTGFKICKSCRVSKTIFFSCRKIIIYMFNSWKTK